MALYRVHLHVARSDQYPDGSSECGYEFIVPLDGDMQLDPEAWNRAGTADNNPYSVRTTAWLMAGHWTHHQRILAKRLGLEE